MATQQEAATGRLLGELMLQSHRSYSSLGLGCAETDALVALVQQESQAVDDTATHNVASMAVCMDMQDARGPLQAQAMQPPPATKAAPPGPLRDPLDGTLGQRGINTDEASAEPA